MLIFYLLHTVFIIVCLLLVLLILLQQGKGSMGIGGMGGGTQMLFGGSGGQDLFQKMTWVLGAIFIGGSLALSIIKTKTYKTSRYLESYQEQTRSVEQHNARGTSPTDAE